VLRRGARGPVAARPSRRPVVGWSLLVTLVVGALVVTPLAPAIAESTRVSVCSSRGGGCGYRPAPLRCSLLSRDSGVASALTPLRRVDDLTDGVVITKYLDGRASVQLDRLRSGDLDALAAQRLGVTGIGPSGAVSPGAVYRFGRHDDADAWLERYDRVDVPVTTGSVGPRTPRLHQGISSVVRLLGFADPDSVAAPDGVVLDLPTQVSAGGFARVGVTSSGLPDESSTPGAPALRGLDQPGTLELDDTGRVTATGSLGPGDAADGADTSLPARLGLLGTATYQVVVDASGRPTTLLVAGEAGQNQEGGYLAAGSLARIRDVGASVGLGGAAAATDRARGLTQVQTVVLDLRNAANLAAFGGVFVATGPLVLPAAWPVRVAPRTATGRARTPGSVVPDRSARAAAVSALVGRIASDAVFVRTRVQQEDRLVLAPGAGGAQDVRQVGSPVATAVSRETETSMTQGFSEDFAVSASRMTAMPGCAQ
jgi:hypothetical protein